MHQKVKCNSSVRKDNKNYAEIPEISFRYKKVKSISPASGTIFALNT